MEERGTRRGSREPAVASVSSVWVAGRRPSWWLRCRWSGRCGGGGGGGGGVPQGGACGPDEGRVADTLSPSPESDSLVSRSLLQLTLSAHKFSAPPKLFQIAPIALTSITIPRLTVHLHTVATASTNHSGSHLPLPGASGLLCTRALLLRSL